MAEAPQLCAQCKYWNNRVRIESKSNQVYGQAGYCVKTAPSSSADTKWPVTNAQDFCGEFVQKG